MGVMAEEEQPSASVATGDREGKQIFFLPQPYPAESPLYYQDSYAYGANPFAVSSPQLPFFNRNQEAGVPAWPWTYPSLSLGKAIKRTFNLNSTNRSNAYVMSIKAIPVMLLGGLTTESMTKINSSGGKSDSTGKPSSPSFHHRPVMQNFS